MSAPPAGGTRGPRRPAVAAAGALGAVGGALLLQVRDPHVPGSYGFCPWLALTGTACPLCGGLRAVRDLGNGDLLAAASSNLLVVAALPVVMALVLRYVVAARRGSGSGTPYDDRTVRLMLLVAVSVAVAFWVVRNLPFAGWLAP